MDFSGKATRWISYVHHGWGGRMGRIMACKPPMFHPRPPLRGWYLELCVLGEGQGVAARPQGVTAISVQTQDLCVNHEYLNQHHKNIYFPRAYRRPLEWAVEIILLYSLSRSVQITRLIFPSQQFYSHWS